MATTIIARDHPKWRKAEHTAQMHFGKSLEELGWEGHVLATIERGEDPKRVVLQLGAEHGTPSVQEHSQ